MCVYIHIQNIEILLYKTTLNGSTMGSILNDRFEEVVDLGSYNIVTMVLYERSFGTQIKRSIQGSGGGRLERFTVFLFSVMV